MRRMMSSVTYRLSVNKCQKVTFYYKMGICSKVPDSVYPNVHCGKLSLRRGMKEVWVDTLI